MPSLPTLLGTHRSSHQLSSSSSSLVCLLVTVAFRWLAAAHWFVSIRLRSYQHSWLFIPWSTLHRIFDVLLESYVAPQNQICSESRHCECIQGAYKGMYTWITNVYYASAYGVVYNGRKYMTKGPSNAGFRGHKFGEICPGLLFPPHLQHSPRVMVLTGRIRSMVSLFRLLSLPPRKLILDPLLIRLNLRSPYDTPDPDFSGSSWPDSMERRMERAASKNGDSTLSPLKAEVSKKCKSGMTSGRNR